MAGDLTPTRGPPGRPGEGGPRNSAGAAAAPPRPPADVVVLPPAEFAAGGATRLAALLLETARGPANSAADADGVPERSVPEGAAREVAVALAGGGTPRPVYERLASVPDLPWGRVRIFFGDERCVPPDHPASNYRAARESLLSRIPLPAGRVHPMECGPGDREAAAARYAALLPPRLDLLILGIGSDGHTASLFPGSPALEETERTVAPALAPTEPRERLTVTPPVLRRARRTVVLAAGEEKAAAVRRALEAPYDPARCPAQLARGGVWILDRAAAGTLRTPL